MTLERTDQKPQGYQSQARDLPVLVSDYFATQDPDQRALVLNTSLVELDESGTAQASTISALAVVSASEMYQRGARSLTVYGLSGENVIGVANGLVKGNDVPEMPILYQTVEDIRRMVGEGTFEDKVRAFREEVLDEVSERIVEATKLAPERGSSDNFMGQFEEMFSQELVVAIWKSHPDAFFALWQLSPTFHDDDLRDLVRLLYNQDTSQVPITGGEAERA